MNRSRGLRTAIVIITLTTLIGCAGQVRETPPQPPAEIKAAVNDPQVLPQTDPDVIYYVGAAEILGQREQYRESAEYYLRAAELSADPEISARAVRVAVYVNDDDLMLRGVQRWIALQPDNPEPHRYAAIVALREKDVDTAWEHIKIVVSSSEDIEQWDRLARMLAGASDRRTAIEVFDRLLAETRLPPVTEIYQQYSDLSAQFGRLEHAENLASATIDLDPESAEAYNWRGRIRHSMRRLPEARSDFAQAVTLDPENDALRQAYAAVLAEMSDYDTAIAQLEEVAPSAPVLYSKALYASAANDDDRARAYFTQLAEFQSEDASRKAFMLGQLAETLEMPADEILPHYAGVTDGQHLDDARLRSAVVLAGSNRLPQARIILGRLQNGNAETASRAYMAEAALVREAGDDKGALNVYDRALDLLPDDVDLLFARALHAESLDMIDITERDLRRVLELQPDDPNVLNALGYTLADRTDRYQEALDLIERAYAQTPNQAAVIDSLGWVHFKLGNIDLALKYLREALDLQFDGEISAHLGEALWVQGQESEAKQIWQDALELEPDNEPVLETRSRLLGE